MNVFAKMGEEVLVMNYINYSLVSTPISALFYCPGYHLLLSIPNLSCTMPFNSNQPLKTVILAFPTGFTVKALCF
jgi:hypothetical protein